MLALAFQHLQEKKNTCIALVFNTKEKGNEIFREYLMRTDVCLNMQKLKFKLRVIKLQSITNLFQRWKSKNMGQKKCCMNTAHF